MIEGMSMKGCYILVIRLNSDLNLNVSKNFWNLKKGIYTYIGSAMNSIEARVARHLSQKKKKHWHIDYLLERAEIVGVVFLPCNRRCEEEVSRFFEKHFVGIKGFGASDLRVSSNLYFIDDVDKFFHVLKSLFNTVCQEVSYHL